MRAERRSSSSSRARRIFPSFYALAAIACAAVLAVVLLGDDSGRAPSERAGAGEESFGGLEARASGGHSRAATPGGPVVTSERGPGAVLDAGGRMTPELLGLAPVAIGPNDVHVPRETRLREATDAIARFAERVERLEDERRRQLLTGDFDTDRLDDALAATRRSLAIAEFAERAIREEPAHVSP